MQKKALLMISILISAFAYSQEFSLVDPYTDSVEKTFTYEHGTITLRNGIGTIVVPPGFKYLNTDQAERVLVDLWGNPKSEELSLGFLLPENQGVLSDSGYVFNIEYDEIGYVEDGDAGDVNYEELMEQMKKDAEEANAERQKEGFEPISIIGWAAEPYYDSEKKILHWAKEIKFGTNEINTLNYNVRVLGRKGVLILNAIASMPSLPLVQKDVNKVLDVVKFSDGNKYTEYDSSVDKVAAWTIGGLVAGKILAKVGFLALIIKFWKLIAIAVVAFFSSIWNKFRKKKDEPVVEEKQESTELPENNA